VTKFTAHQANVPIRGLRSYYIVYIQALPGSVTDPNAVWGLYFHYRNPNSRGWLATTDDKPLIQQWNPTYNWDVAFTMVWEVSVSRGALQIARVVPLWVEACFSQGYY